MVVLLLFSFLFMLMLDFLPALVLVLSVVGVNSRGAFFRCLYFVVLANA